jgi:hypothetical protein
MDITLRLSQQPEADELLSRSPLAAMTGMLLDQQMREVSEAHDGQHVSRH